MHDGSEVNASDGVEKNNSEENERKQKKELEQPPRKEGPIYFLIMYLGKISMLGRLSMTIFFVTGQVQVRNTLELDKGRTIERNHIPQNLQNFLCSLLLSLFFICKFEYYNTLSFNFLCQQVLVEPYRVLMRV